MDGFGWPFVMALQIGPSVVSFIILLLACLLAPRIKNKASFIVLVILFSFWGMVWESSYGLFLIAGLLLAIYSIWKLGKGMEEWVKWTILALFLSIPFALLQGGTISEMFRKMVFGLGSSALAIPGEPGSLGGFALRWPPAVISKHLGSLEIFSPPELFVAILELGPVVLLTPWITLWAWKRYRQGDWMLGAAVISAWVGFILPIFFSYEYDRDIVRSEHGLWIGAVLIIMTIEQASSQPKIFTKLLRWNTLIIRWLLSLVRLVHSVHYLTNFCWTLMSPECVGSLSESEVFDSLPWRATMLTGRLTRVVYGNMSYNKGHSLEWEALRADPTVERFLEKGFRYVYIDGSWWKSLSEAARASLSAPCVQVVTEQVDGGRGDFRRLVDLGQCEK
jgi:hypothetical protein